MYFILSLRIYFIKVYKFWVGHKNLQKSPNSFELSLFLIDKWLDLNFRACEWYCCCFQLYSLEYFHITKGQLFSKGLYGTLNSSKKFDLRYHSTVRSNFFVFWKNWRPQKTFEINWPLIIIHKSDFYVFTFILLIISTDLHF